jgi:hypothetical protein
MLCTWPDVPFDGSAVVQNDQVQVGKDHKLRRPRARGSGSN